MKHVLTPFEAFSFVADDLAVGGLASYGHRNFQKFDLALQVAYELTSGPGPMVTQVKGVPVHQFRLDDTSDVKTHAAQELEVLRAVGLLHQARRQGLRVLVTCAQGRNRSAMVAAEYLIQCGNPARATIQKIKERRANSLTNPLFLKWLERAR